MKLAHRPLRFVVIPPPASRSAAPSMQQMLRMMHLDERGDWLPPPLKRSRPNPAAAPAVRPSAKSAIDVVKRSAADGSLLLAPGTRGEIGIEQLMARMPAGMKIFQERWYSLDRPARPWAVGGSGLKRPQVGKSSTQVFAVTVRVGGARPRALADATVTVMVDEDRGIGLEATTDRYGKAQFELSAKTRRLDAVYVTPLHSGWPARAAEVVLGKEGLEFEVLPIDLAAADVRGAVQGRPPAGAGKAVRVAVIDTGVGPHRSLNLKRARNTTATESSMRTRDEDGHGTHVAGVIASAAPGWRRGEASAVELHAYRIFESGSALASNFAIASAIKDAALQGCDLVNLSIGGGVADEVIRDAIEFAWARGCVCVAATGNDGQDPIDYPARYERALAVSAIGLIGSWPLGAALDWTLSELRGNAFQGQESFAASFSNHGDKVALTAPGVAVVSSIPGSRWGVMSGTSMATPIATGVLARRLAASPAVRNLSRNAERAARIVQMALAAAEDIGLPASRQGRGLVR